MAKTRLNMGHRNELKNLARKLVNCDYAESSVNEAYKKASPLVLKTVKKTYPAKDMNILKKYQVCKPDKCIKLKLTAGGIEQFDFRTREEAPLVVKKTYQGQIYEADHDTTTAVQSWIKARDDFKDFKDKTTKAYISLINASKYFEDLVEVWPEAEELRDDICQKKFLPCVVTPELIETIHKDMKTRKKEK